MTRAEFLTIALEATVDPEILIDDPHIIVMLSEKKTPAELREYIINNY